MELLTPSTWLYKDWVPAAHGCTMAEFCRVIKSICAIASSLLIPVRMQRIHLMDCRMSRGEKAPVCIDPSMQLPVPRA